MKNFDLDNLERKNIYKVADNLFENIQERVLSGAKTFDLDNLERKNIYTIPENLFETVQGNVLQTIKAEKKAPIFKMNWGYAVAASVALIFGVTFVYNTTSEKAVNVVPDKIYAETKDVPEKESQMAYETLASDLTSVENNNQKTVNQVDIKPVVRQVAENSREVKTQKAVKAATEVEMNEYLEALTSSEIAELAANSSQDVYLDLFN